MGKSESFLFAAIAGALFAVFAGVEFAYDHITYGNPQAKIGVEAKHYIKLLNEDNRWERGPNNRTIGIYDSFERQWRILIEFDGERCVKIVEAGEDIRWRFAAFEIDAVREAFIVRLAAVWGKEHE